MNKLKIGDKLKSFEVIEVVKSKGYTYDEKGNSTPIIVEFALLLSAKGQERVLRTDRTSLSSSELYFSTFGGQKYKTHSMIERLDSDDDKKEKEIVKDDAKLNDGIFIIKTLLEDEKKQERIDKLKDAILILKSLLVKEEDDKLEFSVIGASANLSKVISFDKQKLANELQDSINGANSTKLRTSQLTQEFVDKYEIKATFHSGTFMGFAFKSEEEEDEALDEFNTFKKK